MTNYEWRVYDIGRDDWDTAETKQELGNHIADDNYEVWLYRWTERHGLTDRAEVKGGKLPEHMEQEGYKVPKRFHEMLEKLQQPRP